MSQEHKTSPAILVIVVILSALVSFGVARTTTTSAAPSPTAASPTAEESVFDRVAQTGVIKAGYVPYPPGCIKDPNTGELSGIFVDALEAGAGNLGLTVDWAEEVGWGSMIEGLKADRYDIIGSPVWANSTRARQADFTMPLFYSGIGAYVRADDARFDSSPLTLNRTEARISTIDGEMSSIIATQDYPSATVVSHPQLSDNSQLLLDVVHNKADVTFVEPYIAGLFLANNPGTVRNIVPDNPVRIFPNTMMLKTGETEFLHMLDTALAELHNTGVIGKLMATYVEQPGSFYAVAHPYRSDATDQ